MYSFTDRELAEELASLSRKGVRVRVYRDREQFQHEMQWGGVTTTGILLGAGIEVRVKGARDLMHLNYVVRENMWCPAAIRAYFRSWTAAMHHIS